MRQASYPTRPLPNPTELAIRQALKDAYPRQWFDLRPVDQQGLFRLDWWGRRSPHLEDVQDTLAAAGLVDQIVVWSWSQAPPMGLA